MDKVIVVTGASAGIGAALARQLAAKGAKLVLAARRQPELEAVAAACGPDARAVVADVTSREQVQKLFDTALEKFGRVDVWVNNAGRGITRLFSELSEDDLDAMWRDNVKSAFYGMQVVLPYFKARGAGQIVNVSSGLGRMPTVPFRSAYSAAKHALNALSACLRMELAGSHPGLTVSVVMPGPVATDFGASALGGGPDSRSLPNVQSAEDAAAVIADVIERPRPEAYTAPQMQQQVEAYYQDVAKAEQAAAARFRR